MARILITALALALLIPVTRADVVKSEKPVEKKEVNEDNPLDKEFIVAVAQANNNCENCLTVFEKLTSSDKVKDFAKAAKKDHDDLQKDVGTAIKNKKLSIVATPDKATVNKLNELRKMDKEERDQAFLKHFVEGHEKLLKMAEHQKEKGKDEDANELAKKMIPVLKDHLKKAKELQKETK